jgi:hypothetical protein
LKKIEGYCEGIALDFAYSFDGEKGIVGNFIVRITGDSLAVVIGLPQIGKRYFKNQTFQGQIMGAFHFKV